MKGQLKDKYQWQSKKKKMKKIMFTGSKYFTLQWIMASTGSNEYFDRLHNYL